MPGVDQKSVDFHLIVDDSDAMYLTELMKGHQDIHVYVKHLIHDPILVDEGQDAGEGVQPLALKQDFTGYYDNNDDNEHDDYDEDDFYSFMIVITCMLMIKLLTMRMNLRLMLIFLLRWLLLKWVQGE